MEVAQGVGERVPVAQKEAGGLREGVCTGDTLGREGVSQGDADRVAWGVEAAGDRVAVPQPLPVTEGLWLLVSVGQCEGDGVPDPQMLSVALALGCADMSVRLPLGESVALCVELTVGLPPAVGSVRVTVPVCVTEGVTVPERVIVPVLHPLPVPPAVGSVRVTVPVRVTERVTVPERVLVTVLHPLPVPPAVGSVRVTVPVRVTERVTVPERVLVTVPELLAVERPTAGRSKSAKPTPLPTLLSSSSEAAKGGAKYHAAPTIPGPPSGCFVDAGSENAVGGERRERKRRTQRNMTKKRRILLKYIKGAWGPMQEDGKSCHAAAFSAFSAFCAKR